MYYYTEAIRTNTVKALLQKYRLVSIFQKYIKVHKTQLNRQCQY